MPMLKEYITDSPLYLMCGFIVWIPVAIWVLGMVHWMIQGDLDVLSGMLGSMIAVALGAFTLWPPVPALAPLTLFAIIAIILMYPLVRNVMEKRAHVQIDVEAVERAYDMLDESPGNFSARWRLAQVLYSRGVRGHAVAIAEDLLEGADQQVFHEELRLLGRWKEDVRNDTARALPCFECHKMCDPGELYCARCGSKFLLDYAKGRWLGRRSMRRLISIWIAGVAGLVGVPTAATALPPSAGIFVVPLLMLVAILIIWRAFGSPKEADTA